MDPQPAPPAGQPVRLGRLALISNLVLTVVKIGVGGLAGSAALVADGVHSGADAVSSAAAWLALRAGAMPPDADHPYGHARLETAAALLTGILLAAMAVEQGVAAVGHLLHRAAAAPEAVAAAVALGSVLLKAVLWAVTRASLRRTDTPSPALAAQATDHLMDVLSSAVALAAIVLARAGWPAADDWGALAIAALIAAVAWEMGRQTVDDLTDRFTDRHALERYRALVSEVPGVLAVPRLRARVMGAYVWVEVEVAVDGAQSLQRAHEVAHAVKTRLENQTTVVGASVQAVPVEPHRQTPAP